MYFDDYSTSFQSLYSPMYNLQTNYSAMGGGNGVGYGMGMMGGFDPLMSGVGVGQMGADQLVRGDETRNNYYTRPVATHKKKDELPMMLGILGTALGTAAMLLALKKGKFKRTPKPPVTPPVTPPVVPPTNVVDDVVQNVTNNTIKGREFVKPPHRTPVYDVDPATLRYAPAAVTPIVDDVVKGIDNLPVIPDMTKTGFQPTFAPKYIAKDTQPAGLIDRIASNEAIKGGLAPTTTLRKTSEGLVYSPDGRVVPLPDVTGPAKNPLVESIINPGKKNFIDPVKPKTFGKVIHEMPNSELATLYGIRTPEAEAAYNNILKHQFNPELAEAEKLIARKQNLLDAIDVFSSKEFNPNVGVAQNKLLTIRPDLKGKGNIVHTTHTDESIKNAYSLGSRATLKGDLSGFPDVVANKLGNFGLELNLKEFAKLSNKESRYVDKIIKNGTDKQIKNLTSDPKFQNLFNRA